MPVSAEQTHFADGYTSRSVINVANNFNGIIRLVPDLAEGQGVSSLATCELTGAASVSATNEAVEADGQACYATIALTVAGTYTVTWTYATIDATGGTTETAVIVTGTLIAN